MIDRIDVFPVRLPAIGSLQFASGSTGPASAGAPHVFVRITDAQGHIGWGEARPVLGWSPESIGTITGTIREHLAPALEGASVTDVFELHRTMDRVLGQGPSMGQPLARAAIDLAVHDLLARRLGLTLRELLGGDAKRRTVDLSYTVTATEPDAAAQQTAEAAGLGFKHFNFKAGKTGPIDAAIGRAIRAQAGAAAFVWADANQGYDLARARRAAPMLRDAGVDVLEQPLRADQLQQMRSLRQSTSLPLAIDEASVSPADLFQYAREGLLDYFVLKLTRSGGLFPSRDQWGLARAAGLPMLVSGLTDSLLTKLAACQFAAAFGCSGPAALNGSQFTDEDELFPTKSTIESGGTVTLPATAGLGVEPDEAALQKYAVE